MRYKTAMLLAICVQLVFCVSSQKKIQEAKNKDPRHQYNMGLYYMNEGNYEMSIRHLNKSMSLDNSNALTYNALGLVYSLKGEFDQSINYINQALKINPKLTDAHNQLGCVYQQLGIFDKAEQEFMIAISDTTYPSSHLPYYNLARLYVAQDKNHKALEYVQTAISIDDRFVMAYNLQGIIFEKLNLFEDAIKSYKKALDISHENRETGFPITFSLAVAYFKINNIDKAKELFRMISIKTTDPVMKKKVQEYLKSIEK